jgi:hypothetical protein
VQFSFGQANGVGRASGWTIHETASYGTAAGVGGAQGVAPTPQQIISLYGRRSGMMLQGSGSQSGGDTRRLVRSG